MKNDKGQGTRDKEEREKGKGRREKGERPGAVSAGRRPLAAGSWELEATR
jgi:hypothetical protein